MKPRSFAVLLFTFILASCATPSWNGHPRPSQQAVAVALSNDDDKARLWDVDINTLPEFDVPKHVRPCCAFGTAQKVEIGFVPLPLFRLGNTVSLEEIGPHRFDAGTFPNTTKGASASGISGGENNGMIYTQRGGFIDLAHVRDTADDTVSLFFIMIRHLGENYRIELPGEIGPRYIQMSAFDTSELSPQQRWYLAAELAARTAYFKAESHEIAQWHGYTSFIGWPEVISAYSPEDLYSNMLGAKVALALVHSKLVMNDKLYNQSMTVWLNEFIRWLQPVTREQTDAMFNVVDGYWWDSCKPIPEKFMVLKRHYAMGDTQYPHLVPENLAQHSEEWDEVAALYQIPVMPHPLSMSDELYGFKLDDLATLHMEVAPKFQKSFQHIPEAIWKNGFDQTHFGEIAYWDNKEDKQQMRTQGNKSGCVKVDFVDEFSLFIYPNTLN